MAEPSNDHLINASKTIDNINMNNQSDSDNLFLLLPDKETNSAQTESDITKKLDSNNGDVALIKSNGDHVIICPSQETLEKNVSENPSPLSFNDGSIRPSNNSTSINDTSTVKETLIKDIFSENSRLDSNSVDACSSNSSNVNELEKVNKKVEIHHLISNSNNDIPTKNILKNSTAERQSNSVVDENETKSSRLEDIDTFENEVSNCIEEKKIVEYPNLDSDIRLIDKMKDLDSLDSGISLGNESHVGKEKNDIPFNIKNDTVIDWKTEIEKDSCSQSVKNNWTNSDVETSNSNDTIRSKNDNLSVNVTNKKLNENSSSIENTSKFVPSSSNTAKETKDLISQTDDMSLIKDSRSYSCKNELFNKPNCLQTINESHHPEAKIVHTTENSVNLGTKTNLVQNTENSGENTFIETNFTLDPKIENTSVNSKSSILDKDSFINTNKCNSGADNKSSSFDISSLDSNKQKLDNTAENKSENFRTKINSKDYENTSSDINRTESDTSDILNTNKCIENPLIVEKNILCNSDNKDELLRSSALEIGNDSIIESVDHDSLSDKLKSVNNRSLLDTKDNVSTDSNPCKDDSKKQIYSSSLNDSLVPELKFENDNSKIINKNHILPNTNSIVNKLDYNEDHDKLSSHNVDNKMGDISERSLNAEDHQNLFKNQETFSSVNDYPTLEINEVNNLDENATSSLSNPLSKGSFIQENLPETRSENEQDVDPSLIPGQPIVQTVVKGSLRPLMDSMSEIDEDTQTQDLFIGVASDTNHLESSADEGDSMSAILVNSITTNTPSKEVEPNNSDCYITDLSGGPTLLNFEEITKSLEKSTAEEPSAKRIKLNNETENENEPKIDKENEGETSEEKKIDENIKPLLLKLLPVENGHLTWSLNDLRLILAERGNVMLRLCIAPEAVNDDFEEEAEPDFTAVLLDTKEDNDLSNDIKTENKPEPNQSVSVSSNYGDSSMDAGFSPHSTPFVPPMKPVSIIQSF